MAQALQDFVSCNDFRRHRGSGASKVKDHHVRENTILSFLKAATNHTDFIEFDVHVCKVRMLDTAVRR